jgi:hypothetical protein
MRRTNSTVTVINHLYKPDLTDRSTVEVVGRFLTCICFYKHRRFKITIKTTFSDLDSPSFHICAATNVGISNYSHKACYVRFV